MQRTVSETKQELNPKVVSGHTPPDILGGSWSIQRILDQRRRRNFHDVLLCEDGQTAVAVSMRNGRPLVETFEVGEAVVKEVIAPDVATLALAHAQIIGRSLWFFSGEGFVVQELSLDDWTCRRRQSLQNLFPAGEQPFGIFFVPRTPIVWIETYLDDEFRLRVISLDETRVLRSFSDHELTVPVWGTNPAKIVMGLAEKAATILNTDGSQSIVLEKTEDWLFYQVTVGPWGEGFLASRLLVGRHGNELVVFDAQGELRSRTPTDADEVFWGLVTLPSEGCTLVTTHNKRTGIERIWSYVYTEHGLELNGMCTVPRGHLIQNSASTAAAYVCRKENGDLQVQAVPLVNGLHARKSA
jgi:hypothetical protein